MTTATKDNLYAAQKAQDKYNLQSILFLCTQYIDNPGFVSRSSLHSILQKENNKIHLGFHGTDHTPFDLLSKSDLELQCLDWFRFIKDLKIYSQNDKMMRVSLPHGRYNRSIINSLREFGFTSIYTSNGGFNSGVFKSEAYPYRLIRRNCVTKSFRSDSLVSFTTHRHHYIELFKSTVRQFRRETFNLTNL